MSRAIGRKIFDFNRREMLSCGFRVGAILDDKDHLGQRWWKVISWNEGKHTYIDEEKRWYSVPLQKIGTQMESYAWAHIDSVGEDKFHSLILP